MSKARESGKKSGSAATASRRKRKALEEELKVLLVTSSEEQEDMTEQDVLLAAMLRKAQKGDVAAATWVRDTIGEKPRDKKEISSALTATTALTPAQVTEELLKAHGIADDQ